MVGERIPDADVPIVDRTVVARAFRQPGAARVQVRVLARRVALLPAIRRHPQMLADEAGPLADRRIRLREREGRLCRQQAVSDRIAKPVAHTRIYHRPPPYGGGSDPPLSLLL